MANETKGITVKIDAGLHAQVREYVETHGMTMGEFVAQALDNELHPKYQMKEINNMANTRTIAFQVPEDLFQRIKEYLTRNNMTQRQFFLSLIEAELERDQMERSDIRENEPAELEPDTQDHSKDVDSQDCGEDAANQTEAPADCAEPDATEEGSDFAQTL